MPAVRFVTFICLLASFTLCIGCGPKPEKLVPVSGKITIQGSPLPHGNLTLTPDVSKGNTTKSQPRATIQSDGSYTLETDGKPGAPPGVYQVAIFSIKPSTPEEGMKPPVWAASQEYSDPGKSGLTLNVVEQSAANAYDIALTKK